MSSMFSTAPTQDASTTAPPTDYSTSTSGAPINTTGAGAERNVGVTQTQAPQWVTDAGQNLFNNAVSYFNQGTPVNPNPTIAGLTPDQQAAQQQIESEQGSWNPEVGAALNNIQGAAGTYAGPTSINANVAAPTVSASTMGTPTMSAPGAVSTGSFDAAAAQQYMSPFIQAELTPALQQIQQSGQINQRNLDESAGMEGAMGGGRQGVADAQNTYDTQMADNSEIGTLENQGYTQAQSMYTSDQARQLAAQQSNQQTGLATGEANLGAAVTTDESNQAANLQAQEAQAQAELATNQLNQTSGMFNVTNPENVYTAGQQANLASGEGEISGTGAAQGITNTDTANLMAVGGQDQGLNQASLNAANAAFTTQSTAPLTAIQTEEGLLNQTPYNMTTVSDTATPTPSAAQPAADNTAGLVGAGLTAASMFI